MFSPSKLLFTTLLALIVPVTVFSQIIDYQTTISLDGDKKITEKKYQIQINSKEESWLSKIEINHSPSQAFTLLEANIIDLKGNILRKLKKKEILTRSDFSHGSFYQDDLVEEFDLFWNEYPYRIVYHYRIKEPEFLFLANWYPIQYFDVPVIKSSIEIILPYDFRVSIDSSKQFSFSVKLLPEAKSMKWSLGPYKAPKEENFIPELQELIPSVQVIPANFNYGVAGMTDSWSSFGSWMSNLNSGLDELPDSEKEIVSNLLEGVTHRKEIIKILYYYLQDHTKYVNVAIDVGGFKSYPASYVSHNKYGDCKALTTYMKALLKYADIESNYCLVKAGPTSTSINELVPSQQFNHVILAVPLSGDTVWLENTSNILPFGYLGTFTQDRPSLMIKEDGTSELVYTPPLLPSEVLTEKDIKYSLDSTGSWNFNISLSLRGDEFEQCRYYLTNESDKDFEKFITSVVNINSLDIRNIRVVNNDRDKKEINIELVGSSLSPIERIGHLNVIKPSSIQLKEMKSPETRKLAAHIPFDIHKSISISYPLLKENVSEVILPENVSISSNCGSYNIAYMYDENRVTVHEKLLIKKGRYPLSDYPVLYDFIESVIRHQKTSAILLK